MLPRSKFTVGVRSPTVIVKTDWSIYIPPKVFGEESKILNGLTECLEFIREMNYID